MELNRLQENKIKRNLNQSSNFPTDIRYFYEIAKKSGSIKNLSKLERPSIEDDQFHFEMGNKLVGVIHSAGGDGPIQICKDADLDYEDQEWEDITTEEFRKLLGVQSIFKKQSWNRLRTTNQSSNNWTVYVCTEDGGNWIDNKFDKDPANMSPQEISDYIDSLYDGDSDYLAKKYKTIDDVDVIIMEVKGDDGDMEYAFVGARNLIHAKSIFKKI